MDACGKRNCGYERPPELVENGGDQEFIQFWVNSPGAYKMEAPYYLPISAEDTPLIHRKGASIGVVAGDLEGVRGPRKHTAPKHCLESSMNLTQN